MVLTAINAVTEFRPWSEELRGTVNITAHVEDQMSIMDRITALDGESIHNEVLFIKKRGSVYFCYTTYNIKNLLYIGLYVSQKQPLKRLVLNVDYVIVDNVVRFSESFILANTTNFVSGESSSITIRYQHAPQFHVIEMKRDTMQTYVWSGGVENNQNMPVSAMARRSHYQLSAENLSGDRFINNSYLDEDGRQESVVIQTFATNSDFYLTQGDNFNYVLSIVQQGQAIDITARTYKIQVRDINNAVVFEFIQGVDLNIIAPNFISLIKSIQQTTVMIPGIYSYDLQEQIGNAQIETILSGKFIVVQQQTV
jgi:hypothetical protein